MATAVNVHGVFFPAAVGEEIIVVASVVVGAQCAHYLRFERVILVEILAQKQVERWGETLARGAVVVVVFSEFGVYGMGDGPVFAYVGRCAECG